MSGSSTPTAISRVPATWLLLNEFDISPLPEGVTASSSVSPS